MVVQRLQRTAVPRSSLIVLSISTHCCVPHTFVFPVARCWRPAQLHTRWPAVDVRGVLLTQRRTRQVVSPLDSGQSVTPPHKIK